MPARFTNEEYADMHFVYGFCGGNGRAAAAEYRQRFPNRRVPHRNVFYTVHRKLRETGSFPRANAERVQQRREREDEVLEAVQRSPHTSVRRISMQTGIGQTEVWRTLHDNGLYPYHIQKVQALLPDDYAKRVEFCRWLEAHPGLINSIMFSDEAQFTRDGVNNTRNAHSWSLENPHEVVESNFQYRFSVNVWCGILGNQLIGPHFIEGRLTAATYRHFLENELPQYLEDVPLQTRRGMWLQHDGAGPHFGREVTDYLNAHFQGMWIGRGGPVAWPPRSPDLTPLDFFLWGCMKSRVYYSGKPETREQLLERITEAAAAIKNDIVMLGNIRRSIVRRLAACIGVEGRHFENVL